MNAPAVAASDSEYGYLATRHRPSAIDGMLCFRRAEPETIPIPREPGDPSQHKLPELLASRRMPGPTRAAPYSTHSSRHRSSRSNRRNIRHEAHGLALPSRADEIRFDPRIRPFGPFHSLSPTCAAIHRKQRLDSHVSPGRQRLPRYHSQSQRSVPSQESVAQDAPRPGCATIARAEYRKTIRHSRRPIHRKRLDSIAAVL